MYLDLLYYNRGYRFVMTFSTNSGEKSHYFCGFEEMYKEYLKYTKERTIYRPTMHKLVKDRSGYVNSLEIENYELQKLLNTKSKK